MQPKFSVVEFVPVRRTTDKGHKMCFRWIGLRRISNVLFELVYDVTKLNGEDAELGHSARLTLYRAIDENQYCQQLSKLFMTVGVRVQSRRKGHTQSGKKRDSEGPLTVDSRFFYN